MSSNGLMAFWADIDPDYVMRYLQWHNCEHIPERVSISGFNRGCRYRAMDNRPHFLMFYETDEPAVFKSEPYLDALNTPTDWTKEALTYFQNPSRNIYRLVNKAGDEGQFVAPWITSIRFNTEQAEILNSFTECLGTGENVQRVRLYEVDEEISQIMTSERKIYGGGPGAQQYFAMIEVNEPEAAASAIDEAYSATDLKMKDSYQDDYWLEMVHIDNSKRNAK